MAIKVYNCTALTGGGVRALDAISQSVLVNGDRAITLENGKLHVHAYNSSSMAAESSPGVVRPNDYASAGVWENQSSPFGDIGPTITATVPIEGDIRGGDITVSGNTLTITPTSCKDSTGQVALYTGLNKTCVLPATNNGDFYIFIVRLVSNSSCDFRAYSTYAGPSSDAQIDRWRFISFAKNNGLGVTMPYIQIGGRIDWITKTSQPVIAAILTNSLTPYNIAAVLPVALLTEVVLANTAGAASAFTGSYDGSTINTLTYASNSTDVVKDNILPVASYYAASAGGALLATSVILRR
jgi:hypothetical protein